MRHAILCGILALGSVGCVHEADKKVLDSTINVGQYLKSYGADETSRVAGAVVEANGISLRNVIGSPAVPVPEYTPSKGPGEAEKLREEAKSAHEQDSAFLGGLASVVTSTFPWATGVFGIGGWLLSFLRKRISDGKLQAVYAGVDNVVKEVKSLDLKSNPNIEKIIVDTMRTTAGAHNLYLEIKKDLTEARKKS